MEQASAVEQLAATINDISGSAGKTATAAEEARFLSAVAVVGWYWYVWAMYKEAMGNPVGEWLYVWYKAAKTFSAAAERRIGAPERAQEGATL